MKLFQVIPIRYLRGRNGTLHDVRRRKWLKPRSNGRPYQSNNKYSSSRFSSPNNKKLSLLVEDEQITLFANKNEEYDDCMYEEISEAEYNNYQMYDFDENEHNFIAESSQSLVVINIQDESIYRSNQVEYESDEEDPELAQNQLSTEDTEPSLFNAGSFIIDSGATNHICGYPKQLYNGSRPAYKERVRGLYNESHQVTSIGTVEVNDQLQINNVLLVPSVRCNIISVSQLSKSDVKCVFGKTGGYMMFENDIFLTFNKVNGLYIYTHPKFKLRVEKESIEKRPKTPVSPPPKQKPVEE